MRIYEYEKFLHHFKSVKDYPSNHHAPTNIVTLHVFGMCRTRCEKMMNNHAKQLNKFFVARAIVF